ncbi:MAG: efflux RND transporter permease subunit [Psychromonas sp.]|nr:efflux RND transporter permease subunit [Psychromonas sp.]
MWLSDVSVKRPVAAIVLSLLLTIFGYISFTKLAVREMPNIENPTVSVRTTYKGAAASIVEVQITNVIEKNLKGISGIDEITSNSRNGLSSIHISFKLGTNFLESISDIRDAVQKSVSLLPSEADAPIINKNDDSGEEGLYIKLHSTKMDREQLTNYAQNVLSDRFGLVSGVSSVSVLGGLFQVMYIKLSPDLMAGRGVTTTDIVNALKKENIQAPAGELRNNNIYLSVRTTRLYKTAADFGSLVVRKTSTGDLIYLREVAKVSVGAKNEDSSYKNDGTPYVSLGIMFQSDANPLEISKTLHRSINNIQKFLPKGTTLSVEYDATNFISQSIKHVYHTLIESILLVILVLYLFLGQARATLIPAITVPVALISSFIVAHYLGYSVNLITLMALILAIGLVVDDAIVVVENVFYHIEHGESPLAAAFKGTREVGFAVIATTLVLVMVFLPISFMQGKVGLIFTQFSVLLSTAVLSSCLIALTLTPVLASKMLKTNAKKNRFNLFSDKIFLILEGNYRKLLKTVVRFRLFAPVVILFCLMGSYFLMHQVPSSLSPKQDRGVLYVFVAGAQGAGYQRMLANMNIIDSRLAPLLKHGVIAGYNTETPAFGGRLGSQTGFVIIQLNDWNKRKLSAEKILGIVSNSLKDIPDVRALPMMPSFMGHSSSPVEFVLEGANYNALNIWANKLQNEARESGLMTGVRTSYSENTPELKVVINKVRADALGISASEIVNSLNVMLGGVDVTSYIDEGNEYDVYLRGDESIFHNSSDLSRIHIRSESGKLISLDSLVSMKVVATSARLSHNNKQKSITIIANLKSGKTLGEALTFLDASASKVLPADISVAYSGESKDFKENQSSVFMIFGLALLIAYLVLAAQFENFINPLVIMFTVPMGIFGGFIGLVLMSQGFNIYSEIGMLMLIGMVTKNGILIVEFANQLRDRGFGLEQAIIDGSVRRFRPILMTSFATVAGAIPLMLSTGAGSESHIAVGTVVFFGMVFATVVSLVVIPAMYYLISGKTHSPAYTQRQLEKELQ